MPTDPQPIDLAPGVIPDNSHHIPAAAPPAHVAPAEAAGDGAGSDLDPAPEPPASPAAASETDPDTVNVVFSPDSGLDAPFGHYA
jgi:hypothetical protein